MTPCTVSVKTKVTVITGQVEAGEVDSRDMVIMVVIGINSPAMVRAMGMAMVPI